MYQVFIEGGVIRKLWGVETHAYRDHLLRLDAESRRNRFCGTIADDIIRTYAATARGRDAIVHGFFVDGVLRGVADLRILGREAEAAFSIEKPWQSHGVGSALLERTLLVARNRGIKLMEVCCLAENQRMQQLARKFEAELNSRFRHAGRQNAKPASDPAVAHAGDGGRRPQLRRRICRFPIPPVDARGSSRRAPTASESTLRSHELLIGLHSHVSWETFQFVEGRMRVLRKRADGYGDVGRLHAGRVVYCSNEETDHNHRLRPHERQGAGRQALSRATTANRLRSWQEGRPTAPAQT